MSSKQRITRQLRAFNGRASKASACSEEEEEEEAAGADLPAGAAVVDSAPSVIAKTRTATAMAIVVGEEGHMAWRCCGQSAARVRRPRRHGDGELPPA